MGLTVASVRCGYFVKRFLIWLADEVGVTIDAANLHADRLKALAIERTVNDVTLGRRLRCDSVPTNVNVTLVAFGADVLGGERRVPCCGGLRTVDPDFVDDQSMRRAVCGVLAEHDASQVVGLKRVDGCRGKPAKRNLYMDPVGGGNCAAERYEFERRRKISSSIQQADERQVFCGNLLGSETPEVQRVAQKVDFAVTKIYDADLRVPTTALSRLPFQAQGVWRRIEGLGFDGQFSINKFEAARCGSFATAVKVSVLREAVVEQSVPVILGVRVGYVQGSEQSGGDKCGAEHDPTGKPRSAFGGAAKQEGGTHPRRDRKSAETAQNRGDSVAPLRKRVRNCMKLLGLHGCNRKQRSCALLPR